MRSRARRWARVVDEATWPEILRRYLLATRAMMPQLEAADLAADSATLDDDATAIKAAQLLETQPYHRCAAIFSRCVHPRVSGPVQLDEDKAITMPAAAVNLCRACLMKSRRAAPAQSAPSAFRHAQLAVWHDTLGGVTCVP
jgi:hypothetical protein